MAGLQRKTLSEIRFEATGLVIVGLIIAKLEPTYFTSKRSGDERGVITFTIRDSKRLFSNCKYWGTKQKVEEYAKLYGIGDIIYVYSPKVIPTSVSDVSEKFQPLTTTPFCLVLNEGTGSIEPHCEKQNQIIANELKQLSHLPIKSPSSALNLADVKTSQNTRQYVDLFVVIKYKKPVRTIRTSSGSMKVCLELIVMDKSMSDGMSITLWDKQIVYKAEASWKPLETVLQIIDANTQFSPYYKSTILGTSNRTIIIEVARGVEVDSIKDFASSVPLNEVDGHSRNGLPDVESIKTVMTVKKIYDRTEANFADENDQFSAVLFAVVTKFDLDGYSRVISKRCNFCKRNLPQDVEYCESEQCQLCISFNNTADKFQYYFDINVHLTDHTGTLVESKLSNQIAENVLGVSVEEFQKCDDKRRNEIKWNFLLERCMAKLVIKKKSIARGRMFIVLMDLKVVDLNEVAENILLY